MKRIAIVMLAAGMMLAGCNRMAPPAAPAETPAKIRVYTQYQPGDTLNLVQTELGLNSYDVRYRSGMPDGQMGMVYFLPDGDLHIDAEKTGDTWVLLSVPILEPSDTSAAEREIEWDAASDQQKILSRSQR